MNQRNFRIVRRFENGYRQIVRWFLTLEEALEHCRTNEANSVRADTMHAQRRTRRSGLWWDTWEEGT